MNDILSLNINFEKHVLELRTEEFEEEIPFFEIKTSKKNGNKLVEFVGDSQSFVLIVNKGGKVIDYFFKE